MTDNKQKGFGILSDDLATVRENIFGSSTQVREDLLQNYVLEEDPILVPDYDNVEEEPYVAPSEEKEEVTEKKKQNSLPFAELLKGLSQSQNEPNPYLPNPERVGKNILNTTSDIISGVEKYILYNCQHSTCRCFYRP